MSSSERKIADEIGKFVQPVKKGREMNNSGWIDGRIIVSNKRIILASNKGERKLPLEKIEDVGGRYDVNQKIAGVSDYVSLTLNGGNDIILLTSSEDTENLERSVFGAVLDHRYVLVKSPAVEGGVVQDTEWERSKLKTDEGELALALETGKLVSVELDDVSAFEATTRSVKGEKSGVLEVEHTSEEGSTVETHISSQKRIAEFVGSYVSRGLEETETAVELDETQRRVLVALYSGVSPFDIPDFLDKEVGDIEEIYERLIEAGVLEEVRVRREVDLTTRGRNMASEAMNE
ncbi:CheF family chemotaxis protein [Haladaptatus sp. F3-133]|uniref:Taxis protein CheF n=1 Tax=Halorutilus salinus TaxID=2487751 RepID=A0A9Q4GH44_9EURY|nr:CheF family chemotaxis protein [Halorutilus salinus]MCX2818420.1 CheF family chemotaxis protein [Halorutilus salinus]